jgi:hypothetical protein
MFVKSTQDFDIWMEIQFKFLHFLFNTTYTFEPIIPFQLNFIINYSNILKCINLIEIQFLHAYFYIPPFLVFWHIMFDTTNRYRKLNLGKIWIFEGKYPYWPCRQITSTDFRLLLDMQKHCSKICYNNII